MTIWSTLKYLCLERFDILSWINLRLNNAAKLCKFILKMMVVFEVSKFSYRHIWSEDNLQVYCWVTITSRKIDCLVCLITGIMSRYIFKNGAGQNVTGVGDRYRAMITDFFVPQLKNHDVLELCKTQLIYQLIYWRKRLVRA